MDSIDIIETELVKVDGQIAVEDACDVRLHFARRCLVLIRLQTLLSEDSLCLSLTRKDEVASVSGLFDVRRLLSLLAVMFISLQFADVNAFLTLAATRHTFTQEDLLDNPRVEEIVAAAKAGHVPVQLVSSALYHSVMKEQLTNNIIDLSEKNPLVILPYDATIISLLEQFSRGTHRGMLRSQLRATKLNTI